MARETPTAVKLALREHFYDKCRSRHELTIATIQRGSALRDVIAAVGVENVIFLVAVMIRNFCQQYNVSKNMSQDQIEDLAGDLVLDFKDRGNQVRLEELAIFFDRAAKGEFNQDGKSLVFDRIDRGVIELMLDRYFEQDRTAAVWQLMDERSKQHTDGVPILPRTSGRVKTNPDDGYKEVPTINDLISVDLQNDLDKLEKKYGNHDNTNPQSST